MSQLQLSRRAFLVLGSTAAGGLAIALYMKKNPFGPESGEALSPNAFIKLEPDNTITLWSKNPDMGQGVKTAMPMIIADEMEADWSKVKVEQADLNTKAYGDQGSGGSDSITSDWENMRRAGALARELLITAAAQQWNVDRSACEAKNSTVTHTASGKSLTYGELASAASKLPIPKEPPALKDPSQFSLIGKRVNNVENHKIVTGEPVFGLDTRVPGMLVATITKSPGFAGKPVSIDDSETKKVPGVRQVVKIDGLENPTHLQPGVAVVADHTWAAMKGKEALKVTWDESSISEESSSSLRNNFEELAGKPGKVLHETGNVKNAFSKAAKVLESVYEIPFLAHATMEPMNCIAHVHDGQCEIWGPLQMPMSAQRVAAKATGLPEAAIKIHVTRLGGGFGRRLLSDYVAEAAYVSQKVGAPVQIVWTRPEDLQHDFYRPAGYHRVRAAIDANRKLIGWNHHLVNVSRNAYRKDPRPPETTEIYGMLIGSSSDIVKDLDAGFIPTHIPNLTLEYSNVPTGIPTGAWRAPAHNANAFVIQSMIDEIAHETGKDFVELQTEILGRQSDLPAYKGEDPNPYNPDRIRGVLDLVAEKSGWGKTLPEGHGLGIAAHYCFGSYAAEAADISVESDGKIKIHRIWIALDCGIPVNISGLEAQAQGGIIDGLSSSMWGEVTIDRGRAQQSNFDSYRLMRNNEAPPLIEVHIVPSKERPKGFGEIALPPVAPTLANAIFAATGKRIRKLPFAGSGFSL
ncbi:molybdopterin-dependent oxidoreductase [bacterium]|nr:molybdopterin-dependent oxidoreductase [bacterium]